MIPTNRHKESKMTESRAVVSFGVVNHQKGPKGGFWGTGKACDIGKAFTVQNSTKALQPSVVHLPVHNVTFFKLYSQKSTPSSSSLQRSIMDTLISTGLSDSLLFPSSDSFAGWPPTNNPLKWTWPRAHHTTAPGSQYLLWKASPPAWLPPVDRNPGPSVHSKCPSSIRKSRGLCYPRHVSFFSFFTHKLWQWFPDIAFNIFHLPFTCQTELAKLLF